MKHRKFPAPQISEAVFRGKKSFYNFEVYPLNIEFNDVPAVYVISRRKLDKHGRAHHAVFHLGQTESLAAEVKSHRRTKTVKEWEANAVSVLLAESESSRRAIEADLKAALPALKARPKVKKVEKSVDLRRAKISDLKMPAEFENRKNIGKFPGVSSTSPEKASTEKSSESRSALKNYFESKKPARSKVVKQNTVKALAPSQKKSQPKSEVRETKAKLPSKAPVITKKKTVTKNTVVPTTKPNKKRGVSAPVQASKKKSTSKTANKAPKTKQVKARQVSHIAKPKTAKTKAPNVKSRVVSAKTKLPAKKTSVVSRSKTAKVKTVAPPAKTKKLTATKTKVSVRQPTKAKQTLSAKKPVRKTPVQKASTVQAKAKQPKKRIVNLKKTVKNVRRKAA